MKSNSVDHLAERPTHSPAQPPRRTVFLSVRQRVRAEQGSGGSRTTRQRRLASGAAGTSVLQVTVQLSQSGCSSVPGIACPVSGGAATRHWEYGAVCRCPVCDPESTASPLADPAPCMEPSVSLLPKKPLPVCRPEAVFFSIWKHFKSLVSGRKCRMFA